jgi:hypothetical protein
VFSASFSMLLNNLIGEISPFSRLALSYILFFGVDEFSYSFFSLNWYSYNFIYIFIIFF